MTTQPYQQIIITHRVWRILQKIRNSGGTYTYTHRTSTGGRFTVIHGVSVTVPNTESATAAAARLHRLVTV